MITRLALKSAGNLRLVGASAAVAGVFLFLACNRDSTGPEIVAPEEPATEEVGRGPLATATVPLPFHGTVSSSAPAFWVSQTGSGSAGGFDLSNSNNPSFALFVTTKGSGAAIHGENNGTGRVASFFQSNSANTQPAVVVSASGSGNAVLATARNGDAVLARTWGRGRAGVFQIDNASSGDFALEGNTNGGGAAVFGGNTGTGQAAFFQIHSSGNTSPAIYALISSGTGPGLQVDHNGSSGHLALFRVNGANRIRFTRSGKGIFNGGTQTGGADVAEALAVEGRISAYEPGDVLVISTRSDRRVEKAGEPYSTRVIGVYATKPGVLLTERGVDESLVGLVPVGVVGVIPTKVSTENGAIRRGDILVTAGRPGHAMRASPIVVDGVTLYPTGAILGKALEEFRGPGTGRIRVLVNVK